MSRPYYRVVDDPSMPGRWYLRGPTDANGVDVDPRRFTAGLSLEDPGPLTVRLRRPGMALDFTLADFDMPVVRADIAEALQELAPGSIQRFPVEVEGVSELYEILNVTARVRCLDEEKSRVTFWTAADYRAELAGRYRMVVQPTVDPAAAKSHMIFRIAGWEIALIVAGPASEVLAAATGITLQRA